MKRPVNTILASIILLAGLAIGLTISQVEYDRWADYNDDGYVGIDDIVSVAEAFGGDGEHKTKAYQRYDSGLIDITSFEGQYIDIVHNLSINRCDVFVDAQICSLYSLDWNQTYGRGQDDVAYSIIQTDDGGFALTGDTNSFGGSDADVWLVKTDREGNEQWNKTFGGGAIDKGWSVIQTNDGGFAVAGETYSFGNGYDNFYLVKTNSSGDVMWTKYYGGPDHERANSLVQTADGGYLLAGYTKSYGAGDNDAWLVKTNSTGGFEWDKTFGGIGLDEAYTLIKTSDGGYALAGNTFSYGAGNSDFWLIKFNSTLHVQWNKTYGGGSLDKLWDVVQTDDDGYALIGESTSFSALADFWLVKTNATGHEEWNQTYGGSANDNGHAIVQTCDGGFVLAGPTRSYGGSDQDFWLVKVNATGDMEWDKVFGGSAWDNPYTMINTADGGYAIAGYTQSYSVGAQDFWLVKAALSRGLTWKHSSPNILTLYIEETGIDWDYIRVQIWKIRD